MRTTVSRPVQFSAFVACFDLKLDLTEGTRSQSAWFARLRNVEIKDGGVLKSFSGEGDTVTEAIVDCAEQCRGCLIVENAYVGPRREIQCPNEWLPEAE